MCRHSHLSGDVEQDSPATNAEMPRSRGVKSELVKFLDRENMIADAIVSEMICVQARRTTA